MPMGMHTVLGETAGTLSGGQRQRLMIARAIVAKSSALGGTMTLDDLAHYSGEWLTAATTNYHGYDVSTLPPPAQTWATDEMLNILETCVPVWVPGKTLAMLCWLNPGDVGGVPASTPVDVTPYCASAGSSVTRTAGRPVRGQCR